MLKNEHADIRFAEKGGKPEDQGLNFPEYACHGGGKWMSPSFGREAEMIGFPIWIKGVEAGPIGAIIVSGLAQLEDHQLIVCSSPTSKLTTLGRCHHCPTAVHPIDSPGKFSVVKELVEQYEP